MLACGGLGRKRALVPSRIAPRRASRRTALKGGRRLVIRRKTKRRHVPYPTLVSVRRALKASIAPMTRVSLNGMPVHKLADVSDCQGSKRRARLKQWRPTPHDWGGPTSTGGAHAGCGSPQAHAGPALPRNTKSNGNVSKVVCGLPSRRATTCSAAARPTSTMGVQMGPVLVACRTRRLLGQSSTFYSLLCRYLPYAG